MARGKSTGGKEALKKQQFGRSPGTVGAPRTCISTSSFRFIEECARQLDGEILKHFKKSCFGHFKHLPRVKFCSHLVHNILLKRKDEEEEEEEPMSFIIGSQEICFGEREFAMMSGLKFQGTGEIVQKPKEEIRLMKVYFPGQKCVKLEDLIGKFHELKNSEDKLKLGLVVIVENAITGHDTRRNVDKGHLLLVDNLGEFNSYPWGKLFYKVTRDSLIRAKGKLAYHLNGFPHVFQAWIFESIPSLKKKYTVKNKNCPEALHPRILHMEMPQPKAPSHEQIRADLSCVDIEVLSTLHLTQEEVKESYMAGLLSEVDISGVRGHEKDSGAEEQRHEDNSTEQREANHCSSPTNSLPLIGSANLATTSSKRICVDQQKKKKKKSNSRRLKKVDNRIGTATKEYTTLSNDEDQGVLSLENLRLKLRNEINILHKQKSAVESDVGSLSKEREEYRCKLIEEKDIIDEVKSEFGRDIDTLNQKKSKLGTDTELLYKEKEILQCDFDILRKEKTRVESDVVLLHKKKTKLGNDIELLSREKSEMETCVEFLKAEKNELNRDKILLGNDIELLNKDKTEMKTEIESLSNEKTNLRNETELLRKENMKFQSDFEILKGEKSTVQRDVCSLNEMKITVQGDICSLNEKKTTKQDDIRLLNDKKTNLGNETELLNTEKTKLQTETEFLNREKTELVADVALVKKRKCEMETDFELLQDEKNKLDGDIESLNKEKAKLGIDFEVGNKDKVKLQNDIQLLSEEKDKLQSDIEYHNEEKAEFIRSVTADLNESFSKREKRLAENEKMFKEKNQTLVANTEELQEARQDLIKVMLSEKVTKNPVIGVNKRKRGGPELWNFREKRRATLKEVIRFQLIRTDK
ncbi:hypothetical protein MKX03_012895 [Papaver bracteatum]|nr:hypothetical protein MKX03_012895 [Papaver bracteatum]